VESLAAILLVMLVIALLVNYAAGGMPRVGAWLHAKYVGD